MAEAKDGILFGGVGLGVGAKLMGSEDDYAKAIEIGARAGMV